MPRGASARVGTETGQVLGAKGDVFSSVLRVPVTLPTEYRRHEAPDRDFVLDIGSVVRAPRGARLSSEPPIEKPKPGVPRVLGNGIELDADLRDRVALHVAND
jgi:hypothetical protein